MKRTNAEENRSRSRQGGISGTVNIGGKHGKRKNEGEEQKHHSGGSGGKGDEQRKVKQQATGEWKRKGRAGEQSWKKTDERGGRRRDNENQPLRSQEPKHKPTTQCLTFCRKAECTRQIRLKTHKGRGSRRGKRVMDRRQRGNQRSRRGKRNRSTRRRSK